MRRYYVGSDHILGESLELFFWTCFWATTETLFLGACLLHGYHDMNEMREPLTVRRGSRTRDGHGGGGGKKQNVAGTSCKL